MILGGGNAGDEQQRNDLNDIEHTGKLANPSEPGPKWRGPKA